MSGLEDLFLGASNNRVQSNQGQIVSTSSAITPVPFSPLPAQTLRKDGGQHGKLQAQLINEYRRETVVQSPELKRYLATTRPSSSSVEAPQVQTGHSHGNLSARRSGSRWESRPVKEIKATHMVFPLGAGRSSDLQSEEPYYDAIRPMSASKRLQDAVQSARHGGVFRTFKAKGSLTVRNHYRRPSANFAGAGEQEGEFYEDLDDPFISFEDDQILTSSHNWSIDVPAPLPVAPALRAFKSPFSSRATTPLASVRGSSALDSLPPSMVLASADPSNVEAASQGPGRREKLARPKSLSPFPSSQCASSPPVRPRTSSPMIGHPADSGSGSVKGESSGPTERELREEAPRTPLRPTTPTVRVPSVELMQPGPFSPDDVRDAEKEEGVEEVNVAGESCPASQ